MIQYKKNEMPIIIIWCDKNFQKLKKYIQVIYITIKLLNNIGPDLSNKELRPYGI